MKRLFVISLGIAGLTGLMLLPMGCGGSSPLSNTGINWESLMTCPGDQRPSEGNLVWAAFTVAPTTAEPRPGDEVAVSMTIINDATTSTGNANIQNASNIRIWLSFDTTLGPEDYLTAEYVMPGLYANAMVFVVDAFNLPRPNAPPDFAGADASSGVGILMPDGTAYADGREYRWQDLYFPTIIPATGGITDPDRSMSNTPPNGYNPAHPPFHPIDPDQDYPEYIGPPTIDYNVIAVLDSQNCIIETQTGGLPDPEPSTRVDEHQAETDNIDTSNALTMHNPNLPNLQIKFLDRQPTSIPGTGGPFNVQWEVLNAGIGTVTADQPFGVRVYFSENEQYDMWDANTVIGDAGPDGFDTWPSSANWPEWYGTSDPAAAGSNDDSYIVGSNPNELPIFGNSNNVIVVPCRLPYYKRRQNWRAGWTTSPPLWPTVGMDAYGDRTPPPNGQSPGWTWEVGAPVPSQGKATNILIGQVDSTDSIVEADELDNYSNQAGSQNGTLDITAQNGGPYDFLAVELVVDYDTLSATFRSIDFKYDNLSPSADTHSVGWYLSENDTAQSADWLMERFWYSFQTGTNRIVHDTFTPPVFGDAPPNGAYYFMGVLDDIFKQQETYEDNNFMLTQNTFNWQR